MPNYVSHSYNVEQLVQPLLGIDLYVHYQLLNWGKDTTVALIGRLVVKWNRVMENCSVMRKLKH